MGASMTGHDANASRYCARFLSALIVALALSACGSGGQSADATDPPVPPPTPPPEAPFGLTMRAPLATLSLPGEALPLGDYTLEDKFPGLRFRDALYLTANPDDDRLIVVEQHGLVHAFANDPGVTETTVVLDLSERVIFASEQGLLGLVFDPDFGQNRYLYVHYSLEVPRRSVIARFRWDAGSERIDTASEKLLLEVSQPEAIHNGGMLAFGPDGYLYISFGDGGGVGDPGNNAQNTGNLLGSILRIDVHPRDAAAAYEIPLDNPLVGVAGAREEIYAFGFRNPFRFSFDRQTGELWAGDVGQGRVEEIDRIVAGGNYGWRVYEGDEIFDDSLNTLPLDTFEPPVFTYPHSIGFAVIGGYVYRGSARPSLFGRYLYADFVTGVVSALDVDGDVVTRNEALATARSPTSLGEDNAGEVYVVTRTQGIYGLVANEASGDSVPRQLSQTGIFTDLDALQPASGVIEYDVNHPYFSDNSSKRRWVALPDSEQIVFDPNESWGFPVGSVIVQHFEMELVIGDPTSRKRLETRLLLNTASGWQGFTYRWNAEGSDATLISGRQTEELTVTLESGASRSQLYEYPSRTDCLACHTEAAGFVLGLSAAQLNRDFDYAGVTDNQLRSLNHIGMFTTDIGAATDYNTLPAIDDEAAPLGDRARAYLSVNCAQCHRPQGPTPVDLDLRFGTANAATNAIDAVPQAGDLGIQNARIVSPGSKESSVLWQRVRLRNRERMPPLSTHIVDEPGVEVIGRWIDSL